MGNARQLRPGITEVGARHPDRRLFDELIPLPFGTSYNAYVMQGTEKTALIDTVDPAKAQVLLDNLAANGIANIDYVVANHAEQDHSGSIPIILEKFPKAIVLANKACSKLLKDHLLVPDSRISELSETDQVSLGAKTLKFIPAPWVHWPETMFTYAVEDKVLFTCDYLGAHLSAEELYAQNDAKLEQAAKMYYAEIMMPYRRFSRKHLSDVRELRQAEVIAPSHGPVYDKPDWILTHYGDWTSDTPRNECVILYVSMHASTKRMVEVLAESLGRRQVKASVFNLTDASLSDISIALVDAATIVLATPTVLAGPHPAVQNAANIAALLKPKAKFAAIMVSQGWGGRAPIILQTALTGLPVELLETVVVTGYPKKADEEKIDGLANQIAQKHKAALPGA